VRACLHACMRVCVREGLRGCSCTQVRTCERALTRCAAAAAALGRRCHGRDDASARTASSVQPYSSALRCDAALTAACARGLAQPRAFSPACASPRARALVCAACVRRFCGVRLSAQSLCSLGGPVVRVGSGGRRRSGAQPQLQPPPRACRVLRGERCVMRECTFLAALLCVARCMAHRVRCDRTRHVACCTLHVACGVLLQ
jgi:hypothetical protein